MDNQSISNAAALRRTQALARFLDESIPVPGTNYRVGVDFLIGLIPGIGDILGGILSTMIVAQAAQQGVSKATILRMAINILVETIVGAVPVVGDVFDAVWKANVRNVRILEAALVDRKHQKRADAWFVVAVVAGLVTVFVGCAALAVWLLVLLKDALT